MRVIGWPGHDRGLARPTVATIGAFDGVHRGHQEVIGRTVQLARRLSCAPAVVTFDREPTSVLSRPPELSLTSPRHRLRLFEALDVDICVVVRFTKDVARLPADEFVRRVFCDLLDVRALVLGFDFRFGRDREGDVELCRRLGRQTGFDVVVLAPVEADGEPISSTAIRKAVLEGDFARAERLLGRPFSIYGTVVHGDGRGKSLGFPTANLDLHHEIMPPDGVYACRAYTDGEPLPAVTSVGNRRTFHHEAEAERVAEVHLIDFEGQLYGQDVEVQFVERLRGQRSCSGGSELRAAIAADVDRAKRLLAPKAPRMKDEGNTSPE
ncbi:MAG: riboflavin biosynthesis protein RibF [Planctomycetes bacterium]|nr:riboflavin biosynthesis protein RibF [Planctomycetota bacterium]